MITVDDVVPSKFGRESRVMLAKVSMGGHRAATAAVAKPRGAERD